MSGNRLKTSRIIVGIVLAIIALGNFLLAEGDSSTVGAIGIGVLGLITIAISRKK